MFRFLLILAVIFGTIFGLTKYFLEKQKKAALEDLYKSYLALFGLFKTLPRELKDILIDIYRNIRVSIDEIEVKSLNYKKDSDVFNFVDSKKAQRKKLEKQLLENKKKWEVFDNFMQDVGHIKLGIENLQKDLKRKSQDIMISFGDKDSKQEDKDQLIQEETNKFIENLAVVYREYDIIQGMNFADFDQQRVRDVEKMREIVLNDSETYYALLNFYNKEIEIKLMKVFRYSSFYIKLKELLEGYPSGKNKMSNLGEVSVSFKNFEKYEEGSKYRQDVFVSSKRVIQEIEAEFQVIVGHEVFEHIEKLTYDELIDLLNIAKIRPTGEENDESGLAYNFEIENMEISLAKKEKQELLIKYVKELDVILRIPIKKEQASNN